MAQSGLKPIRRVVTGNDERGKSKVVWDGPAPGAHEVQRVPAAATPIFGFGTRVPPRSPAMAMMGPCRTTFPARRGADSYA